MKYLASLLVVLLLSAQPAFAQTVATYGEKQVGTGCTYGASSADFDTIVQCNSLLATTGTMQKAPLFAGTLTSPPYASTTCDANKAGILQWTGTELQYCNGSGWTSMGGGGGAPSGQIKIWPTPTVPDGYLECDGSAVSRTTYAALFAVISTTYGAGDGSTTFNLPDYRGVFLRGWSNGSGNDPDNDARAVGSSQSSAYLSHTHSVDAQSTSLSHSSHSDSVSAYYSGSGSSDCAGSGSQGTSGSGISVSTAGNHGHTISLSAYAVGNAGTTTETRPRNVYMMYIIKY